MSITAQSIVDLIMATAPGMDRQRECDTFKAGSAETVVRRLGITFMATRSVLRRAVELGVNFLITHEPTFFNEDRPGELDSDPVVVSKRAFVAEHGLTIWRCHDALHHMKPDGIVQGMAQQFVWESFTDETYRQAEGVAGTSVYNLPATTLDQLAKSLKQKLNGPVLRVIGAPNLLVSRVGLSVGCPGWNSHRALLRYSDTDALVCGEMREWETCEYVRDSAAAGFNQGLIVLGHANSEEAGMRYLVDLLARRLPQLQIDFLPAGDPFRYV